MKNIFTFLGIYVVTTLLIALYGYNLWGITTYVTAPILGMMASLMFYGGYKTVKEQKQ